MATSCNLNRCHQCRPFSPQRMKLSQPFFAVSFAVVISNNTLNMHIGAPCPLSKRAMTQWTIARISLAGVVVAKRASLMAHVVEVVTKRLPSIAHTHRKRTPFQLNYVGPLISPRRPYDWALAIQATRFLKRSC